MNSTVNPQTETLVYLIQMCAGFIITLVIVFGNMCTIIVFIKHRHLRTISNVFLFSLSISDLCCGILSSILDITLYMGFRCEDGLKILKRFLFFAITTSLLHLVCISMERFITIQFPLHYTRTLTRKVVTIMLITTWMIPLNNFLFVLFDRCQQLVLIYGIGMYVNICIYLLTSAIISILYGILLCTLQRHRTGLAGNANFNVTESSKGLKILSLLIFCYIISWFPFVIVVQIFGIFGDGFMSAYVKLILHSVIVKLAICNSGVNVFIYAFTLKPFRKAYKNLCFKSS